MRKHFDELFTIQNETIKPQVTIQINGVIIRPGVSFGNGVSFGGIDLRQFVGKYLQVELQNEVYVIKGVYN